MNQDTTRLQGIGLVVAKRADEVAVGDTLVWNYGYTSKVSAIRPKSATSKQFLIITEHANGKDYERTMRRDRLVAFSNDGKHVTVAR